MATQTKRPRGRETRQALIQAGVEEINRHGVTEVFRAADRPNLRGVLRGPL